MHKLLVALLTIPLLAGCISEGQDTVDTPVDEPPVTIAAGWAKSALIGVEDDPGHDHRDWTQHTNMSTPNFEKLAHNPLAFGQFGNVTAGGYFCGGAAELEDGRRISVIESFDTNVAFTVVDATDAYNPVKLGDFLLDNAQTYDIDLTPDGKHVVMGANPSTGGESPPGGRTMASDLGLLDTITIRPGFRDACTGETTYGPEQTVAAGPATIMASIEDPENPVFESWIPEPVLGPHSVSTAEIDGTTYAVASIVNLAQGASYYSFYQITDTPAGSQLVRISTYDASAGGDPTAPTNGHLDAEIAKHPGTGQTLVYLSNWGGGLGILDFSVPQAPVPIGAWADTLPEGGAIHSTYSLPDMHDGHHYVLAGQEFTHHPENRPSGWVYILDDTDPANPVEVGRWTLPIDTQLDWAGVELFSTHYFRVVNQTVFVAMYHGGVWAFELDLDHPENMALPASKGVFVPDEGPQNGRDPTGFYDLAPFVLDLFVFDDYQMIVYDGLSGMYSVQFHPDMLVESPEPWPREGR